MKYFTLFFFLLFFQSVNGQDASDTSRQKELSKNISSKNDSISGANTTLSQTENVLNVANTKISELQSRIDHLNRKKNKTAADLELLRKKLDSLNTNSLQRQVTLSIMDSVINYKSKKITELDTLIKTKDTLLTQKDSLINNKQNKTDSLDKKLDSTNNILNARMATIAAQQDSLDAVAELCMNYDSIKIFTKDSIHHIAKAKVESIHLTVHEGLILEIIVKTNIGVFRNRDEIIDLLHLGLREDTLGYERQKWRRDWKSLYVFFDDAIIYTPLRSYSDLPYADFEITLIPDSTKRCFLLKESTSINTYFNVAAFTDIKGIAGDPNGLAQFTADAKFITNTNNYRKTAIVPFHFISFHGALSKFDNDFKGSELIKDDSINRKDLLQRAVYAVGVKLNIFKGFASPLPHHLIDDWQLNIGYNFVGGKVFDTAYKDVAQTVIDTSFRSVTQNQIYIEPLLSFHRHKNFSMTLSLPFYFNNIKKSGDIRNSEWQPWVAPGISLMYYGKRDSSSKLFFRYNHFINIKDSKLAFSQMQLGYSVNITNVWSKKNSD